MSEVSAEQGDKIPSLPVEARAILHRYKEIHKCVKVTLVSDSNLLEFDKQRTINKPTKHGLEERVYYDEHIYLQVRKNGEFKAMQKYTTYLVDDLIKAPFMMTDQEYVDYYGYTREEVAA